MISRFHNRIPDPKGQENKSTQQWRAWRRSTTPPENVELPYSPQGPSQNAKMFNMPKGNYWSELWFISTVTFLKVSPLLEQRNTYRIEVTVGVCRCRRTGKLDYW